LRSKPLIEQCDFVDLRGKPTGTCGACLPPKPQLRGKPTTFWASCGADLPLLRGKPTTFWASCGADLPPWGVDNRPPLPLQKLVAG
jgi:hypothetical protein